MCLHLNEKTRLWGSENMRKRVIIMTPNLANDEIYQTLESEIVSLKIKPGVFLSENSLCKRFSVSRTPVRSILQRLQQDGFVQIVPHKGTLVTPINLEIANQLIYQRVAVEAMVIRDFVKSCTPTDIERCRYALHCIEDQAALSSDAENFDINLFLKKDFDMHEIWFKATGKMYLWQTLTKPQPDYSRFIRIDIVGANNVPDVLNEHRELMNIIDTGNTDIIEAVIHKHLYGGVRRLGGQIFSSKYKDYFIKQ